MNSFKYTVINTINNLASAINNLAQSIRPNTSNVTKTSNGSDVKIKYQYYTEYQPKSSNLDKNQTMAERNEQEFRSLSIVERQALHRVFKYMNDEPDLSSLNYMKIHWPKMHSALQNLIRPTKSPYSSYYDKDNIWNYRKKNK